MHKKFIFSLALLYLVFSTSILNAQFSLEIIIKSKLPVNIQIFYLPEKEKNFKKKNSITLPILSGEVWDTLTFIFQVKYVEKLRIDFGLSQNKFEIKKIILSHKDMVSHWGSEDIISGFIANSNMKSVRSTNLYSFTTMQYNGRFDPNMVLNKNGKNKIFFDLNERHGKIIRSEIKVVAKSSFDIFAFLWVVPQALEKEHYYLLPNRSSFNITKSSSFDTVTINLYTDGFISAFSLDFAKNNSKTVLIKSIEYKDRIRHREWDAALIDKEFILNNKINKKLSNNVIELNLLENQKYVGPRIEYRFDMLKLSYLMNSIEINIGKHTFNLNLYIPIFILVCMILFLFNRKYIATTNY